jgi:hypothetical protein
MIVEDGTGLVDADSMLSVANAEAFLSARGFTEFALLTLAQKEAALVNASEFISTAFTFVGYRKTLDQAQAWPRVAGLDGPRIRIPSGVPRIVQIAVARVANAIAVQATDMFGTVNGGDLLKRAKAGSVEVEFADTAAQLVASGRASFPWLNDLLAPLVISGPDDPTTNGMSTMFVERV